MCAGCMTSAEFVLTSGALSAGAVRLGLRSLLPSATRWLRLSDEEAEHFVSSLTSQPQPAVLGQVVSLLGAERATSTDGEVLRACA